MAELQKPTDRLAYAGDLEPLIGRIAEVYGVGAPTNHNVVEVGYEDCNVIIETDQDRYLAKMFAKTRKPEEITRYTDIMQKVVAAGVSQKRLFERGQKGVFGLYSALQNLNQKIRLSDGKIEDFSDVVRMRGLEPPCT